MTRSSAGLRFVTVTVAMLAMIALGGANLILAQEANPAPVETGETPPPPEPIVAADSGMADPCAGDATADPATNPDGCAAPAADPPVTESTTADPVLTEPAQTDPVQTGPAETEPVASDPVKTDPASTDPVLDAPEVAEQPVVEPAATDVTVLAYAYDCAADPGPVDPAAVPAECSPTVGVEFAATADGVDVGVATTDDDGAASFLVPEGSSVVAVEDPTTITPGYVPFTADSVEISPATEGAYAVLVHVPIGGEDEEDETGRIQLVKGTGCQTTGEPRTELRVIGSNTFRVQAQADEGCRPEAGAAFVVTGGDLPEGGETYLTGDDGTYRGVLAPGSYTVTESASGESAEIEVIGDDIVVVIALEYVAPSDEMGTIAVRRYACAEGDEETTIEVSVDPLEEPAPGASCVAEDGEFQLDDADPFDGGGDGAINFDLPTGSYTFTDLGSATSVAIDIAPESTTYVVVARPMRALVVTYALCDDDDAYVGSVQGSAFWAETCARAAAGLELRLVDEAGNLVSSTVTDAEGVARWMDLQAGVYRIWGTDDRVTCAVFVGGAQSSGGIAVAAGKIYEGSVYACVRLAGGDGSGGGDNGGNTGGGDGNTGGVSNGDGTGGEAGSDPNASSDATVAPAVTALPNTGSGAAAAPSGVASLVVLATIGGLAAIASRRRWAA